MKNLIAKGTFVQIVFLLIICSYDLRAQNALNSGDFSGGSWGNAQTMISSAGTSLIITKTVASSGDKYFRFYGDGTPCGEYQANVNGDYFVHKMVVTSPNASCGSSNAWRINVPTSTSNVVFKTDGENDGINRSVAFVIQGAVASVSSQSRDIVAPTASQSPNITAILNNTLSVGQSIYLRYTTNNFSSSTILQMTGSGTSFSASIPPQAAGTTVTYYLFTSGDNMNIAHADADFLTINLTGSSSYSVPTSSRFVVNSGNWNSTSTWSATSGGSSGASVPSTGDNVFVSEGKTVIVTADANIGSITFSGTSSISVNSGKTLSLSGSVTSNSSVVGSCSGDGVFSFLNSSTVVGLVGFNNVNISAGVNFGTGSTINGTLCINAGGYVNSSPPTYAINSLLKYNSGTVYGRGNEWNATSDIGYPYNVQISNNTTLNVNNGANIARQMAGNLTVDAGSTLSLESMTIASPTVIGLTVAGNVINYGTITLATSYERLKCVNFTNNTGATTTLSSNVGGDLELTGSLIDNATFNSNNRAVFFTGTGVQDVSGTGTFNIDYIVSNKASGSIRMLTNLLVEGPNGGNAMTLTGSTDILDLNGFVLTLGKENVNSLLSGTGKIKGGGNSSLIINGTGSFGTVYFDQSSLGSSNYFASITINRTLSGIVSLANEFVSVNSIIINSGGTLIIPNGAKLTISGALVNSGGTLKIESGGSLVQEGSTANSGTGTYIAERHMTGSGGSTPNGRFWYMGVPMSGATSASLSAGGGNLLWSHDETQASWNEINSDAVSLVQTKGYLFRGGSDATYSFSSNNIGNASTVFYLTRTPGVAKSGFNLLSNPYPSHVSWDALYNSTVSYATVPTGSSPLLPTIWYRTTANNSTTMLFDTYNAEIGVGTGNGNGSGTSGNGTQVTGNIAPFQSFWVRLNEGETLQMTATNAMRSHGSQNFLTLTPATVRLNISNGTLRDETIVVLKEDLSNDYDYRDSGKEIPSTTVHQLYSLEGSTRVAINGIANALAKDSLKLGVQIPTAGTYSINCTELTFSDMVFLEDKLTGSYLELNSTTNYSFTSVAGTFNNRFVLHFAPNVPALPGQTAATAIAMPTSNWPQCNNVTTEDQWHAFTATSEGISIEVNTASTDIVIELQDGTGNVVAQENAVNGIGNETLNFFGLTAGQTYKVGVRNNISSQPTGTYGICVKSLKRGGCDYGAGPYSLCQYYKATWAGSTGVSYTFTFTGTSGPAAGQTFTRTQNSDICVLSTVTPLLPYGSTYDVVISNTYTLTDGAGNTEQITVPSNSGCQVVTIAQPQTTLSNSSSCNNGARFRGAVVSSMPWVCGANNWRWRFTEVNPLTMQEVGLPIELNRGTASNYLSLATVAQLQNGKTYAVQTAPMFSYTGTNYNWGPTQYLCIVGAANVTQDATQDAMQDPSEDAAQELAQGSNKDAHASQDVTQDARTAQDATQDLNAVVYVTEGNHLNIQLTDTASNTAKRADIYDVTGKLVKSVRLVEGMNEVTLTETAGIYMVRTVVGNQSETTRVFLNN